MQVTLPYGQEDISFQVPDQAFLGLLDPPNVEVSTDPEGMIRHAIRNPIGTGTLDSFITKDKKIAVIDIETGDVKVYSRVLDKNGNLLRIVEHDKVW